MKRLIAEKGFFYPYRHVLADRTFLLWLLICFLIGMIRYGLTIWIPLYFVERFDIDITKGLLQSLALAQFLFQFGFFLPAESATLPIVDEVITSIGDRQSALSGLSSFAVEVLTIDRIIKTARDVKRVLALVDELARTTNPDEGKRMVNGFVRLSRKLGLTAVVTTHYSGLDVDCKRLRVKGLQIPENVNSLSIGHISDYMDYSLIETRNDDVPKEAFTIARLLHVDEEFLAECGSGE